MRGYIERIAKLEMSIKDVTRELCDEMRSYKTQLRSLRKEIEESEANYSSVQDLSNLLNTRYHSDLGKSPHSAGERWTKIDDDHLAQQFRNMICDISGELGRSPGSIQSRISNALSGSS